MGRNPCYDKEGVIRGAWSSEEDEILFNYVTVHGEGKWRTAAKNSGLKRCGKSCRLRWLNYLKPGIKRGGITPDEEDLIFRLHRLLGNRWALIAGRIPGRTDNEIKNYWKTVMTKKLEGRQGLPCSSSMKPIEDSEEEKPLITNHMTIEEKEEEEEEEEEEGRKVLIENNFDDGQISTTSKDHLDIDWLDFLMDVNSFPTEDLSPSSEKNNEALLEKSGMQNCSLVNSNFDVELKRVASFLGLEDELSQFPGGENLA